MKATANGSDWPALRPTIRLDDRLGRVFNAKSIIRPTRNNPLSARLPQNRQRFAFRHRATAHGLLSRAMRRSWKSKVHANSADK
jgi:hypothetical protein